MPADQPIYERAALGGPVTYRCLCCGITRSFGNEAEAFDQGWDTPTWFGPEGLASPLCSSCPTFSYLCFDMPPAEGYGIPHRGQHEAVHQAWLTEGRHPSGAPYTLEDYLPPDPLEHVMRIAQAIRRQLEATN